MEQTSSNPRIDFCEAIRRAFQKYANFKGRIRRSEFWNFALFNLFCTIFLIILNIATMKEKWYITYEDLYINNVNYHYYLYYPTGKYESSRSMIIGDIIYILFMIIPVISSIIRRLHDIGKKGYYIFILLVPFIGQILFLIFLCKDSEKGTNEYGLSPKYSNEGLLENSLNRGINIQQNKGISLEKSLSFLE